MARARERVGVTRGRRAMRGGPRAGPRPSARRPSSAWSNGRQTRTSPPRSAGSRRRRAGRPAPPGAGGRQAPTPWSPRPGRGSYGSYDLFVPPNTDERVENELRDALREAIVSARLAARQLERAPTSSVMTAVATQPSVTVARSSARRPAGFNRAVPFVFVGLLVFGVMIGAQTLMTSTVEEKSSRVIEVLLSAVSPLELMAGKILGQMAVSLLVLALYIGIGVLMLSSFAMLGLLDPWLIVYLLIFFLITYFLFASVFGAIGAAVNEMREAQALVTPVMLVLMVPWLLAAPVARDPNTTMAIALSFIPPVNTLAMMIRMASTSPPPLWQVWLSIAVGLAAACAATWVAAKVFRVGLLMYGKPPNFATLSAGRGSRRGRLQPALEPPEGGPYS